MTVDAIPDGVRVMRHVLGQRREVSGRIGLHNEAECGFRAKGSPAWIIDGHNTWEKPVHGGCGGGTTLNDAGTRALPSTPPAFQNTHWRLLHNRGICT